MSDDPTAGIEPKLPALAEAVAGFARMALADKALLAAAWPVLGLSALIVRLFAFRRLAPLLGRQLGAVGCVPVVNAGQEARARMVRRAVRRAARIAPWRNDCLPQAFAAALLCRMLGVPLATHLGVRLGEAKPMEAHAWTCAGPVAVTGGEGFDQWVPVSCFLAAPPPH
jgi:hypothetical protein